MSDPAEVLRLLVETAHHHHPSDDDAARAELGRLFSGPVEQTMGAIGAYLDSLQSRAEAARELLERLRALEPGDMIRLTVAQAAPFSLEHIPGLDAGQALAWAAIDVLRGPDNRLFICPAPATEEEWP